MVLDFTLNDFVVPRHKSGWHSILNVTEFNCYMHIPTSKMPTIKQVWQLIKQGDYTFSIGLKDAFILILLLRINVT